MIRIEKAETYGWMEAIRGMRNPLNSWHKSDSYDGFLLEEDFNKAKQAGEINECCVWKPFEARTGCTFVVGANDLKLMKNLVKSGTDHGKFMRMISVYCDVTAPLYVWKEADTYKVGTVSNSCSTMHKIQAKEFTLDDFSHEHLIDTCLLESVINELNLYRNIYNNYDIQTEQYKKEFSKKQIWWQMIQLLPSSYNQKRTLMFNYQVLANIYHSRKNHRLDEWHTFCDWIKTLPYSELITKQ